MGERKSSRRGERYFRSVTATVLERYYELEDGVIGPTRGNYDGPAFDPRVLDYRIDVERILAKLTAVDRRLLALIHRDGLSSTDAARCAGIVVARPDDYALRLELRLGEAFERAKLMDIDGYLS